MPYTKLIARLSMVVLFVAFSTTISSRCFAQGKIDIGKAIAQKGSELSLLADRSLLDAHETATLTVQLVVPPEFDESGNPIGLPKTIDLPRDGSAPYKAQNWRILEGGGQFEVAGLAAFSMSYAAPAKVVAGGHVTISVDMIPQTPAFPKVVLIKTLYFVENETAIFVSMPGLGLIDVKFTSKPDGGAKILAPAGVDPKVAAKLPPDVLKKLKEAQAKAKNMEMNVNLSALSSNASAYWDPTNMFTSLRFTQLSLNMAAGKTGTKPSGDAVLALSYDGNDIGTFPLGKTKTSSVGLLFPATATGIGCGETGSDDRKFPCDGEVTIDMLDGETMRGTFKTAVYTSVGQKIFRGSIYGKFRVRRVNS